MEVEPVEVGRREKELQFIQTIFHQFERFSLSQPEQNAYSLQAKGMKAPEIYKRNKWMKMKAMRFARRLGDHVALMASH